MPVMFNNEEAGMQNIVDGTWVFELFQGDDCRYFVVERQEKATLIPLIKRKYKVCSMIHSDEWSAYSSSALEGFLHYTVNHQ